MKLDKCRFMFLTYCCINLQKNLLWARTSMFKKLMVLFTGFPFQSPIAKIFHCKQQNSPNSILSVTR